MLSFLLPIIYLAFISLGLPDSVLGAAWPSIYPDLGVPVSYAGIISAIIAIGTVISSLLSVRLLSVLKTGGVTALSVAMTAVSLFGFSLSSSFLALCLLAVPYGLGAGSVDAALNNYVALHYKSQHMSWLHCMWGIGATGGPYIMGLVLTGGLPWTMGYRVLSFIQMALTIVLIVVLPLWKAADDEREEGMEEPDVPEEGWRPRPLREIVKVPGVREIMLAFFCYCGIESTIGLWSGSYLTLHTGLSADIAAQYASAAFLGLTIGRALNGFLAFRYSDDQLIHLGESIILMGALLLLVPHGMVWFQLTAIVLMGLGCAPIYPCIIHATPDHFGKRASREIIGVQMASAYIGTTLMPPLFGLIAQHISIRLWPVYLLALLLLMFAMYERVIRKTAHA
ncbi:MAG: MFS transporter [Clostridia bacterium]|nr:MFS transporter [Clostridia bacterium]